MIRQSAVLRTVSGVAFAILGIALPSMPATAQGTGGEGCYFDACDDDVRRERDRVFKEPRDPVDGRGDYPDPEPEFVPDDPGQLVCITTVGSSCVMMDQSFPAGQFCNCPGPFGSRLDGYTQRVNGNTAAGAQPQQPSIATQCVTYVGSCFLANQALVGSPCYCPSAFGPVQGISQ
ncbi:MAG: hypothetical protein V2I82_13180 [Halieaceae bacterium]|nr:hypothetical protein [Halieaceae bacterium]